MIEACLLIMRIRVCEKCGYEHAEVVDEKWDSEDVVFCPHCEKK